ncbi:MAG TPA: proline--tRNA ligase [Syntrophomonadaceae bacterium]|nr:proline--tRNA ligase [Syntrophomonadaceae bacterium]
MKSSKLFYPTLREVPSEAEIISHQLLLRAGFIRRNTAGAYTYLPLGYRVIKKIINIIREEMDAAGGQEVMMPIIQPRELWEKTGRWSLYGDEMFKLTDRHNRDFALGPTHEELVTSIVDNDVHSYRDLPLLLYQIQNKYRDEIRPRFGLMRGREFIMKDLYSFDVDDEGLNTSYRKMYQAYRQIYERMNLKFRAVEADSGAIGGNESHEFMVLAENGESEIVFCENCNYAANVEKAECSVLEMDNKEEIKELSKIHTPGQKTIQDIVDTFDIPYEKQIKTLMYLADDKLCAVVLRGDRELNEIKLKNFLASNELVMADERMVSEECGAGFGSLGPVGLNVKVYADLELTNMYNFTCGANEDDYHYINVNLGRDFVPDEIVDLRNAVAGDLCPECNKELFLVKGIEVGHIFKLGNNYSQAMDAAFLDAEGQEKHLIMGCYGIGVSRTMAASVEQNYDDNGIIWPMSIAPYHVIVVPVNMKNEEVAAGALSIYNELNEAGIEVLLDDRDERAGVKFKDADLIGIPLRVTIGPKSWKDNQVELKKRWEKDFELIDRKSIVERIKTIINS